MKNKIKFSIIIPAYNIEKYVEKCIESIKNQTYNNYEVIIINDGSTDNTKLILEKYKNVNNIMIINQSNKGLSESRNIGITKSKGDYILFVDGDDYIENDLLEILNQNIQNEDIIRFQIRSVDENYKTIENYFEKEFKSLDGIQAFNKIVNYNMIEPAWAYCYKSTFYKKNKFKFKKDTYHEDFGLVPFIIIKSNNVSSINYIGYNYVQRNNSIMNNNDYNKTYKKVYDVLEQYKYLKENTKDIKEDLRIFNSYISNIVIKKSIELNQKDYKVFLKEIKKYNIYNDLLDDTTVRKFKNILLKLSPKLYYKLRGIK